MEQQDGGVVVAMTATGVTVLIDASGPGLPVAVDLRRVRGRARRGRPALPQHLRARSRPAIGCSTRSGPVHPAREIESCS